MTDLRYITLEIGRAPRPIVGSKLAKERLLQERKAHADLESLFGCGRRCLLVLNVRRKFCTLIEPVQLTYIADFEHRFLDLDGVADVPMTRHRWRLLKARLDRKRRLLLPPPVPEKKRKRLKAVKAALAGIAERMKES